MHHGRCKADWTYTCEVLAMMINVNRDPKTKPIKGSDLNPMVPRPDVVLPKIKMKDLKNMVPQLKNLGKKA